ncbi:hypothetical protein FA15DRAFT_599731 [Coprinopsis marcescibilis]|uniref:DUF6589 domain-containing protein n=1 Tax=Coprinopsis marcescibilis TaxID=230819 RepID=A0A5C3KKI2_COPMA|nr:hypothetical protein FA15DRAFT_599731 [Coprinopsis marcescibilis]
MSFINWNSGTGTPRRQGISQSSSSPSSFPSPASDVFSASPQIRRQTPEEKVDEILALIQAKNLTIGSFQHFLYRRYEDNGQLVKRTPRHDSMLRAFLNGNSKPHVGRVLEDMWHNASETVFMQTDTTVPQGTFFNPTVPVDNLLHVRTAMTTWAVNLTAELMNNEGERMIDRRTGLHLRAQVKEGGKGSREEERVTWDEVSKFSMANLESTARYQAPITWNVLSSYVHKDDSPSRLPVAYQLRPKNLVCGLTQAVMNLTFLRSNRANRFQLCCGIWMFAVMASKTMFRVESRLGLTVADSTVRRALENMSGSQQQQFKQAHEVGSTTHYWVVSDNVQAYAKKRDHRMGRPSEMVHGMAATAIEMEGVAPNAFDLKDLLNRQAGKERKKLTVDLIMDDIDWAHLDHVSTFQFVQTLVNFVPCLQVYRPQLHEFTATKLCRVARPTGYRSKVHPLATNSSNEIKVQELKDAIIDFATQLGIDNDTINNKCWPFSGDGKTFQELHRIRKYSSAEPEDFDSFRWMIPMLEIWHTKWTDMSRIVRAHWGSLTDSSSLLYLAKLAECPTPPKLNKVDFYDGQHMINLALDARILNCWEQHFETTDLVKHFEQAANIPKFEELTAGALKLALAHATTRAHQNALNPEGLANGPGFPIGQPWPEKPAEDSLAQEPEPPIKSDTVPLPFPKEQSKGDTSLANGALFMRDAIWWREVCLAVAEGDTGRVLEMFKLWIFTFSGSGNPLYSSYLLEIYCNFKWEFSPALKEALLMYWLVNLSGLPGCFIELDLMQEHFNFWLEEMVQHKGKEFNDSFYRRVVSMNVHRFLLLKDEMEQAVLLKARTKNHSDPHLDNELNMLLKHLRREELNKFRAGRTEGFQAKDNFSDGLNTLEAGKLKGFIKRLLVYSDRLRAHGYGDGQNSIEEEDFEDDLPDDEELEINREEEDTTDSPCVRMVAVDGELYVAPYCKC